MMAFDQGRHGDRPLQVGVAADPRVGSVGADPCVGPISVPARISDL
jgi:hypothetical protein